MTKYENKYLYYTTKLKHLLVQNEIISQYNMRKKHK